ncbi:hypothetical protein FSP39_005374 [Pinctada imbricata]|uniref:Uncharacterized protein n=1 Tax=Pinctada imbricata TaxID=66713 RepID=A0AA88XHX2_PINIB|nr:hypothetical protein FSP39_005374 [Pinctada imbricata]
MPSVSDFLNYRFCTVDRDMVIIHICHLFRWMNTDEDDIVDDHVQGKIDSKHKTFPPQPELSTEHTSQGQTNTHTTSGKARLITHENDLGAENMILPNVLDCGNNHYKAAFIATLVSSIVIIFLICVALVIYFARKKLRDRIKLTTLLQTFSQDNRSMIEEPARNENDYSTTAETYLKTAISTSERFPEHILENHYSEPCLPCQEMDVKSLLTKDEPMEEYFKLQPCKTQVLSNSNDDYLEPRRLLPQTSERRIGEYFELQKRSSNSREVLRDDISGPGRDLVTIDYFELQSCDSKENKVIESEIDAFDICNTALSNEDYLLETCDRYTKSNQGTEDACLENTEILP